MWKILRQANRKCLAPKDNPQKLKISNRQSRLVPLKQFSSIRHIVGEPDFNHFNGQRSVKISVTYSPHRLYQCYPHPLFD
jgi:multidrug efflux pump subunit AcrB